MHGYTCAHGLIRAALAEMKAEGVEGPQYRKLKVPSRGEQPQTEAGKSNSSSECAKLLSKRFRAINIVREH